MIRVQQLFRMICKTAVNYRFFNRDPPYQKLEVFFGGMRLHGSDVLMAFDREWGHKLFTFEKIGKITVKEIASTLGMASLGVSDNIERATLLNELSSIDPDILKNFAEDSVDIGELSEYLKQFKAYSDPFEKKLQLLCKIGNHTFWTEVTGKRKVPLDYHTISFPIRLGNIDAPIWFKKEVLVPEIAVEQVRTQAQDFYQKIVDKGVDPWKLDDTIWGYMRGDIKSKRLDEICKIPGRLLIDTTYF